MAATETTSRVVMAATEDAYAKAVNEKVFHCTRDGIQYDEVKSIYTYWPACYDQELMYKGVQYDGPAEAKNGIVKHYGDRKDAHILDVCAGTGVVGELLVAAGFTNLDALDGSKWMLTEAEKKGIYKKHIVQFLGKDRIDIEDDTYDGIVSCGCWHNGHVENGDCFPELARVVKSGGWIIIATSVEDAKRYAPTIHQMEAEGKWKWVENHYHDSYCSGLPGQVLFMQVS